MSQLNFYVSDEIEDKIRQEAKSCGKSISSYLASLVKNHVQKEEWKDGFFKKVCGAWEGEFPKIDSLSLREVKGL
jgi:hypothetical protein